MLFLAVAGALPYPAVAALPGWPDTPPEQWQAANSGPGILILEPVAPGVDASLVHFGAGCSRWLQFEVGGQPELGKTPPWDAVGRAAWEMGTSDLRLTPPQARQLGARLGVTHVATAEFSGDADDCTLTYHLWEMPAGKPIGAPLQFRSTKIDLVRRLPGLAATLCRRLGLATPHVPSAVEGSASDLQVIGESPWLPDAGISHEQNERLRYLALRMPLAGLLYLYSPEAAPLSRRWPARWLPASLRDDDAVEEARKVAEAKFDSLLAQAPNNAIAAGALLWLNPVDLQSYRNNIGKELGQHPDNAILNLVDADFARLVPEPQYRLRSSRHAVCCSLGSSVGWTELAETLAGLEPQSDRSGAGGAAGLGAELYHAWETAARRAVALDPLNGHGWLLLSMAAARNGDLPLADRAWAQAEPLDPDRLEVYRWGLELQQPRWQQNPGGLSGVAVRAVRASYRSSLEPLALYNVLVEDGLGNEAGGMALAARAPLEAAIRSDPADALSRHALALCLEACGKPGEAVEEMQAVIRLEPTCASAYVTRASALLAAGEPGLAAADVDMGLGLDPFLAEGHTWRATILSRRGDREEAIREMQAAVAYASGAPWSHFALAELLAPAELGLAVGQYQQALQVSPESEPALVRLAAALARTGQFDAAAAASWQALSVNPGDPAARQVHQAALNHRDPVNLPAPFVELE